MRQPIRNEAVEERNVKQAESREEIEDDRAENWKDALLNVLTNMEPDAFERPCQRVLRENGFTKVKVTGRSGDGGPPERLLIDATHLKAHRTAASLLKKGMFPAVSDAPRAG